MGKTLQRLIDDAKSRTEQEPSQFYQDLRHLIDERDVIIHRFFVERADQLESDTGLQVAIDDLEAFRKRCLVMTGILLQAQSDALLSVLQRVSELFRAEEEQQKVRRRTLLAEMEQWKKDG